MATMRVWQVPEAGADFELVERDVPAPGRGEVVVRVEACGVCHSDVFAKEGGYPGMSHPLVPGHEVAGVIDRVGDDVHPWTVGDRVGVGWFGGHCGWCEPCRQGDFISCRNLEISGITRDGGYAEYLLVAASALAAIPDDLASADAAPLLCAGITTFNPLRHADASPGDLVAVLGVGGLGHLGVQFAARLGFRTVAIARGADKEELARRLGAHEYIDSTARDPAAALQELGGAKVILATAASAPAMTAAMGGLGPRGRMIVVGASMEAIEVPPAMLIGSNSGVYGHASGTSKDSEDTLGFSALAGVRPMIEAVPFEEAPAAYEKMISGDARFRMVITMDA
jgi:D-arabinose 1-dehydrogenase-like Zn-dependent alcohol dehydrogenase